MLTVGKSIAGGVPAGAFGMSAEVAGRVEAEDDADYEDTGGVGGTLAGNALTTAAIRATLGEVLTAEAFERMIALATRFTEAVEATISERALPWHVVQLGARAEYRFSPEPPRNGGEAAAAGDPERRGVPAPLPAESRRPDHALPQHGADVARDHASQTSTATPRHSPPPAPSWPRDDRRILRPCLTTTSSSSAPASRAWRRLAPSTPRGWTSGCIEARDRVGGRTLNHSVGEAPDQVVEVGGQWVGPTQHEAMGLVRELGLETHPTHAEGEHLFEDGRGKLIRYSGTIPRLNPIVLADYGRADAKFKRLAKKVDPEAPWDAPGRGAPRRADDGDLDPPHREDCDRPRGARHRDQGGVLASSPPTSRSCTSSSTRPAPGAGMT